MHSTFYYELHGFYKSLCASFYNNMFYFFWIEVVGWCGRLALPRVKHRRANTGVWVCF